ncbi:TniB family NTP-binding protein [Catenovulum maritimum]|uniref:AAA+ ATPase domain-containing protein n=1 Tax=Catenovulum maritimum TaxID=1513271 RepID=A0A0J8GW76_9ALTE|nr:TniB family NTP-binding protein [Catenovulum maritimum]KMT67002.1 hypothetical protein XM47_01270 [Catenovulum maritimum]
MQPNNIAVNLKSIFVLTPKLKEILELMDDCCQDSKVTNDPLCMLVTGDTGAGKTTLIEHYIKQIPPVETINSSKIPLLSTTLPENATPVSAAQQLLYDLGDPFYSKTNNIIELTAKLCILIKNCGVEMIIIDEFQHMIEFKSKKVLFRVADWLKMLIIRVKIPIILFGLPYSELILQANKQLSGRFLLRQCLEPFRIKSKKNREYYLSFINAIDKALPFDKISSLASDPNIAKAIYVASKGNLRQIMLLINYAVKKSLKANEHQLSIKSLQYAAELLKLGKENPFSLSHIDLNDIIEPDQNAGWETILDQRKVNSKDKKITIDDLF